MRLPDPHLAPPGARLLPSRCHKEPWFLAPRSPLWVAIGLWLNVYDKLDSGDPRVVLRDSFRQSAYGAIGLVVFEFLLRLDLSRPFLLLFATYAWVLLFLFRLTAGRLVGVIRREFGAAALRDGGGRRRARATAGRGAGTIGAAYGIRLTGFLAAEPAPAVAEIQLCAGYPVFPLDDLPALLRPPRHRRNHLRRGQRAAGGTGGSVPALRRRGRAHARGGRFLPARQQRGLSGAAGFTPLLTFSAAPHDEIRLLVKRVIDVVLAAAGLVVLRPFMALIALLIRLTSPGPAIFRQERCGLNGRRFMFYKFRSMCRERRRAEGRAGAPESEDNRVQDSRRPAPDRRGPLPAQVLHR